MSIVLVALLGLWSAGGVDTPARMGSCTVAGSGNAASLTGTMTVAAAGDGIELDIAPSPSGGTPTISAHAINTKGTGATNNGRMAEPPACAVRGVPVTTASCTATSGPDGITATFSVPLAALGADSARTGPVPKVLVILTDGAMNRGVTVLAHCTSSAARGSAGPVKSASWDLGTLKK